IYNHADLLEQIRAESINPAPTPAAATPNQTNDSSIVAALREQLRSQKHDYQTEIAQLKAEVKNLEQALAAAHGELHRRSKDRTSHQRG
ncbi:MAG: transposase, partial [Actinomycetia bacterium]|nr:transposase [Actinomycetes bacterium]